MKTTNEEYTKSNIQKILERLPHFEKVKENGNVDAIIILVDIEQAIKKCKLSDKQKFIYHYHFVLQYTLDEISKLMNVSRPAIIKQKKSIVNKIYMVINGGGRE